MRNVTFYHKETGLLHPVSVVTNDDRAVALNTPADHVAIDHPESGRLDHRTQRVDVSSGAVVAYQAPRSAPDAEWAAARVRAARTGELTAKEQPLLRRLALDPSDETARTALRAIDAEIHLLSENTSP